MGGVGRTGRGGTLPGMAGGLDEGGPPAGRVLSPVELDEGGEPAGLVLIPVELDEGGGPAGF